LCPIDQTVQRPVARSCGKRARPFGSRPVQPHPEGDGEHESCDDKRAERRRHVVPVRPSTSAGSARTTRAHARLVISGEGRTTAGSAPSAERGCRDRRQCPGRPRPDSAPLGGRGEPAGRLDSRRRSQRASRFTQRRDDMPPSNGPTAGRADEGQEETAEQPESPQEPSAGDGSARPTGEQQAQENRENESPG